MFKSVNQIRCKQCNLVRKRCNNLHFKDTCYSCYRTVTLQNARRDYLESNSFSETHLVSVDNASAEGTDKVDSGDSHMEGFTTLNYMRTRSMDVPISVIDATLDPKSNSRVSCCSEPETEEDSSSSGSLTSEDVSDCWNGNSLLSDDEAGATECEADDSEVDSEEDSFSEEADVDFGREDASITRHIAREAPPIGSDYEPFVASADTQDILDMPHVGEPHGSVRICRNCRREKLDERFCSGDIDEYQVKLVRVEKDEINFRLSKGRLFSRNDISGPMFLCVECRCILVNNVCTVEERKLWKNHWPAYFWALFTAESVSVYMACSVFVFVPAEWLKYWLRSLIHNAGYSVYELYDFLPSEDLQFLQSVFPQFATVCQEEAKSVITRDVTAAHREFSRIIRDLKLGELKRGCDKYLIPRILCPWGCTCYLHRVGHLNYDAVLARFLGFVKSVGTQSTSSQREKVSSCRGDFFSHYVDCHLHNPLWTIHPSVVYEHEVGPLFLCCTEHNGGTVKQYFHLPKSGSCLPSLVPESLSHTVLNSRTIRPSKAHLYSNTYQLQKCTASYCGLDSCYVSDYRRFDRTSMLCGQNESRSYFGREDIRGLANRLCDSGRLSEKLVEDYKTIASSHMEESSFFSREAIQGGSMMVLKDAINLQKMISEPQVLILSDYEEIERVWLPYLFCIHPNDNYGCCMKNVGFYKSGPAKFRVVWSMLVILCNIPALWQEVDKHVRDTLRWEGFYLSYCASKILKQRIPRVSNTHPFSVSVDKSKRGQRTQNGRRQQKIDLNFLQDILCTDDEDLNFNSLKCIFKDYESVAIKSIPSVVSRTTLHEGASLEEKTTILIMGRDHDFVYDRESEIDDVEIDGVGFELRLVVESKKLPKERHVRKKQKKTLAEEDLSYSWDGTAHCRYGEKAFPLWWRIERGRAPYHCIDLGGVEWTYVTCLVYAKKEPLFLNNLRSEYLQYMGGQCKAFCEEHDSPLIITASAKGPNMRECGYGNNCKRLEKYYCPALGCRSRICHKCFVGLTAATAIKSPRHKEDFPIDDTQENSYSEGNGMAEETGGDGGSVSSDSCCSQESADSARDSIGYDIAGLHTGDGIPVDNIEDCDDTGDDEEEYVSPVIPSTNCAGRPTTINGTFGYMGSSVLLNKCGTMLVRRHCQLEATRRERNILERVVSVHDIGTVPLVYLEGMLFPSIFWSLPFGCKGGVLGSIPTPLFCRHETREQLNVASVADHMKTRLKSANNHASTDPRYLSFAFDCLANGALQGQDTRVVLSRGFEESMGPAGLRMRNEEDDFYTDTIDNRQNVHNLAASEKECPSTYFLTLTCNQREHFGVRQVKRYIDSDECMTNYSVFVKKHYPFHSDFTGLSWKEIKRSFQEAGRNLIVRNWFEVRLLLIDYITRSPEKPVGEVKKFFVRDEYQDDVGNLSHLHMLIALECDYDNLDAKRDIQQRVRGIVDHIVGVDEVDQLISEGVFDGWDDYYKMKQQARMFLAHLHSPRCMRRTGPKNDDLKCRFPDPRVLSKQKNEYYELNIDIQHSEEALVIMERLGLCEDRSKNGGYFVPLHDFLKAKRILPPCRSKEGNISPVIGKIFAATRSSCNVQICTSFGTSRYIVKYLIKIDENNYVVLTGKADNPESFSAEKIHLHNTKVTSSDINEKKKIDASRNKKKLKGRQISSTEQMQLILGYPQIHTNVDCIRISTLPLAERAGFERNAPLDNLEDNEKFDNPHDAYDFLLPCIKCRREAFDNHHWRQHSSSQIIMLRDQAECPVTLDRIFIFGIRPPELLFVDKLEWYYRFFKRSKKRTVSDEEDFFEVVNDKLELSQLIDGLGYRLFLRIGALPELALLLEDKEVIENSKRRNCQKMRGLLARICRLGMENDRLRASVLEWRRLNSVFMCNETRLPIPVFSNVKPLNSPRFVIHVLLSLGHFETESDLWSTASVSDTFIAARLIQEKTDDDVDKLLLKWIVEQLRFYPIGSKKMDEFIVSARTILYSAIVEDSLPMNEIPPFLYSSLVENTDEKVTKYLKECRATLLKTTMSTIEHVYGSANHTVPPLERLQEASKNQPLDWDGAFPRSSFQSEESFQEQRQITTDVVRIVHQYIFSETHAAKNYIICGPPGSGKTHCMSQQILYCVSQGLCCMTTAILADRALVLGGKHVHKLFCLKVRDKGTPHRLAELAVIGLQRKPEAISLLRQVDVLFFDELGQLSAEQVAILDLILRKIRDSNLFMGGVLVIATLDQHQLRPIKGLPFLLSPFVVTSFSIGRLKHYVRCCDCPCMQEMNTIARSFVFDDVEWGRLLDRFETIVRDNCTFVDSWEDPVITDEVIRVFPRRHQAATATKRFVMEKIRHLVAGKDYLVSHAADFMNAFESHGDWKDANESSRQFLNSKCNEPQTLYFYVGALYQFTFNKPGQFSATQLGIMMDLPSASDIAHYKEFEIYVAPPGYKHADVSSMTKVQLLQTGWKRSKTSLAPQYSMTIWKKGIKVKRKQYGMKIHVSSTIHSAIGCTLGKLACSLSDEGTIWERAMVVVLISRVSFARDLIFVGNQDENINVLIRGLRVRDQYAEYMNHVVDVLVSRTNRNLSTIALQLPLNPFRPKDILLPPCNEGVVYMLVSAKDQSALYIGQTMNVGRRLKEHNSGFGSKESANPRKRPWALYAYAVGFQRQRKLMLQFESYWQNLVQYRKPQDAFQAVDLGISIIQENFAHDGINMVRSI